MFRFTIRELVLVTVIVALAVTWWIDRRQTNDWWSKQVNEAGQQLYGLDHQLRLYQDKDHALKVFRIVR